MSRSRLVVAALAVVLAGLGVGFWLSQTPAPQPTEPTAELSADQKAMAFYATRKTFEQPLAHSPVPEGMGDMRSATCGACHKEIYAEWNLSTHSRAWLDDAQFQAELHKSKGTGEDPSDMSWMCVNCHTPVLAQQPQVVIGLRDGKLNKPIYAQNPTFDAPMQLDAIGCATCHVRDGVIEGPYGDTKAPHPVRRAERLLTEEVCVRCHQAQHFYESIDLGCYFNTGNEWKGSPAKKEGKVCQSCHMPQVERKLAAAFDRPKRTTRRHWFGGSLIPKRPQDADDIKGLRKVFGHGLTFDIKPLTLELKKQVELAPKLSELDQKIYDEKSLACQGDCLELAVVVSNSRAGHFIPTGDPERHVDIEVRAGEPAFARTWTRVGSRYEWWPKVKLLADTRIPPGQDRVLVLRIPRKSLPTQVTLDASKYRMYESAFEHHKLDGKYVRGIDFAHITWAIAKDGTVGLASPAPTR